MDNSTNLDKPKVLKNAQMYFREGEWDKALAEQGKILAADRNDPDSLAAVGDIYAKKRMVQLAFEFYFKAAPFFLTQNRPEEALTVFQKITRLDMTKLSSDVRMDMNIYKSYVDIDETLKDKRYEMAIAPLGKLLKIRPQDPIALALLKAISNQIDQITPSASRYQILGDSFLRNGLLEKAWDMYRKLAELDPQKMVLLAEMAQTFLQQKHESEAKKAFLYLAELALSKDNLDSAQEYAKKAVELRSLEASYVLGLVNFKRQQWAEARTDLEKLLRMKVNHLGALIHLGKTFTFLRQPDKARETFQKALKINENDVLVQEAWVDFCLQGPDKEAAIPGLVFLIEKATADQNHERIVQYARTMIDMRPELASSRITLIHALEALGRKQDAADASRSLAMIYEQQGLLNESSEYLAKANKLEPSSVQEPVVENISIEAPAPFIPSAPTISLDIPEVPLDWDPSHPVQFEKPAVEPIAPVPAPMVMAEPSSDLTQMRLATAQLCIQQDLWKAAIQIYQQILEERPDLVEVRNMLHDVNESYLKRWMEQNKSK